MSECYFDEDGRLHTSPDMVPLEKPPADKDSVIMPNPEDIEIISDGTDGDPLWKDKITGKIYSGLANIFMTEETIEDIRKWGERR